MKVDNVVERNREVIVRGQSFDSDLNAGAVIAAVTTELRTSGPIADFK